jgi:hypothetical protein
LQQSLRHIRKANNDYKSLHICPTVCPKKTMQFPPDGFSCHFVFGIFTEICRDIPTSVQIKQK